MRRAWKNCTTIRSILAKEPSFGKTLNQLDYQKLPDILELKKMNRILTKHFFEKQIHDRRYPTWLEKQNLAVQILQAFPHLEATRASPNDPPESFFFWKNGGRNTGIHTGLIETRIGNMRKDVPQDRRLFRRTIMPKIAQPTDDLSEDAGRIAAFRANPVHMRAICDGMAKCLPLFQFFVQEKHDITLIIQHFPHILSYNGLIIQQIFESMYQTHNTTASIKKFLLKCLTLDKGFVNVEDREVRAALRIMKMLTNRGIKRHAEDGKSMDVILASPLIRWVEVDASKSHDECIQAYLEDHPDLDPHILCIQEELKAGPYYITFHGEVIPCTKLSFASTLEIFVKIFSIFNATVPTLLRKLFDLIKLHELKIIPSSTKSTVNDLHKRLLELLTDE